MFIQTGNPITSTKKSIDPGTRMATLMMVFKLASAAQKRWRKLNGSKRFQEIINGVKFVDGIKEESMQEAVRV